MEVGHIFCSIQAHPILSPAHSCGVILCVLLSLRVPVQTSAMDGDLYFDHLKQKRYDVCWPARFPLPPLPERYHAPFLLYGVVFLTGSAVFKTETSPPSPPPPSAPVRTMADYASFRRCRPMPPHARRRSHQAMACTPLLPFARIQHHSIHDLLMLLFLASRDMSLVRPYLLHARVGTRRGWAEIRAHPWFQGQWLGLAQPFSWEDALPKARSMYTKTRPLWPINLSRPPLSVLVMLRDGREHQPRRSYGRDGTAPHRT